ncbi:Tox-REase-5 domain-containing protein [Ralstonia pseudosolanacearum]|uniref:Tox-REase-5 domain-containing protein n=1 Tax=Ralstonia pseudosolanacearum TaxID=1310165 RepID=UPI003AAEB6DC
MAAAAVPFIEAALGRLLIALGLTVATDATVDQVRKRKEEADNARTAPIAKAESQTKAKEKCKECPPDRGTIFTRTFPVRKAWVDYQARIGGMRSGPTFIEEWVYNKIRFDGFTSAQCLLKEAKGGYDRFFDEWGRPLRWWDHNVEDMIVEIVSQDLAAIPKPTVKLAWFWQEPVSYRYFSRILSAAAPDVPHTYFP